MWTPSIAILVILLALAIAWPLIVLHSWIAMLLWAPVLLAVLPVLMLIARKRRFGTWRSPRGKLAR